VLWVNRERFSVEAEGSFWLSPTPEARVGFGWAWSIPRAVVWLRLRERDSGQALTVVATHMDNNRANKAPGMALLRERLAQLGDTPLLVLGDFNIQAGASLMTELTGETPPALVDSFTHATAFLTPGAPQGELTRACKDFIASPFPGCRIDQILIDQRSKWEVPAYTLDLRRLGPTGNFISDHRAVWVDLKLEPGRR
jgi:endonuclease/exonuclease/phosphatase family metal-dependent hydrolase